MNVVVLDDKGRAKALSPRVEAMLEMVVECAEDVTPMQHGYLEFHFNGDVVHAKVSYKAGRRKVSRSLERG